MARQVYDPDTKAKFMAAALDARKAGKKFPEVLEAAQSAGYKGSLQGISILVRKSGKDPKRARPAKAKEEGAPAAPAGKKRGRPKKAVAVASAASSSLEAIINQIVQGRVNAALAKAIAVLSDV